MREALLSIQSRFQSQHQRPDTACPVSPWDAQTTTVSLCGLHLFSPWKIPGEVNNCPKCRDKSDLKIEDCLARLVWDQFLNRAWSVTFIERRLSSKTGLESAVSERLASPGHSDSALLGALKPVRQLQSFPPSAFFPPGELTLLGMLSVSRKVSNKRPCDAVVDQPGAPISSLVSGQRQEDLLQFYESLPKGEGGGSNVMTWVYHTTPSLPTHSCKYIQQPFCKQPTCPTREDWANKKYVHKTGYCTAIKNDADNVCVVEH